MAMSRSRSRSRSPSRGSDFPLMLLIPKLFTKCSNKENILRLKNSFSLNRILISKALTDSSDELLLTIEADYEKKLQALRVIFEDFLSYENFDFKKNGLAILIPPRLVSVLIGKGGSQIKRFQTETQTEISVVDKQEGVEDRQVRIHGRLSDIENAIESIHQLIKDRVVGLEAVKRHEAASENKTFIKFIVPKSCVGILIGKAGAFAKMIKGKYSVEIKLLNSEKVSTQDLENIAVITGTREDLTDCLPIIVDKLCDIQSNREESIRLLVSESGYRNLRYNIKDIQNSTFCRITAKSENNEYVININGSSESKKEGILMIFKIMKNGYPSKRTSPSPRKDSSTTVDITVPDRMVSRLIGKKGEHVKNMIDKSGCSITFHKTFEGVYTPEGEEARLCTLKGNTSSVSIAVRIILEQVSKLERD